MRILLIIPVLIFSFKTVSSFDEIPFDKVTPSTLVVLDIDDVLIVTEDHFGHPEGMDLLGKLFMPYVLQYGNEKVEKCASLMHTLPKRILIEKHVPSLLNDLKARGVKVIGLTNCRRGPYGYMPSVEEWRAENLRELGITFSYDDLDQPLLHKGILFSRGYTKGEVLKQFLTHVEDEFDSILLVDDLEHNLESVAQEVGCEGYLYSGAKRFYKPLNLSLLKQQLDTLFENEVWIPDPANSSLD